MYVYVFELSRRCYASNNILALMTIMNIPIDCMQLVNYKRELSYVLWTLPTYFLFFL